MKKKKGLNVISSFFILFIIAILNTIVSINFFKTHEITWYLIALAIINFWLLLPVFWKNFVYIIVVFIGSLFVLENLFSSLLITFVMYGVFLIISTIFSCIKTSRQINKLESFSENTDEPENKWQKHLEKNYKATGKRTNMADLRKINTKDNNKFMENEYERKD